MKCTHLLHLKLLCNVVSKMNPFSFAYIFKLIENLVARCVYIGVSRAISAAGNNIHLFKIIRKIIKVREGLYISF